MREIKFKAWDDVNKKMWYSDQDSEDIDDCEFHIYFDYDGILKAVIYREVDVGFVIKDYQERQLPVMQYTGLKDKNGVEIYEGDIVVIPGQYIWFDDGKPNYRGTVEWIYSQWQVVAHCVNKDKRGISDGINEGLNDIGYDEGDESCWEVIGNIHENPELMEP